MHVCKSLQNYQENTQILLSTRNDDQVSEVHLELFQTPEMDIAQKK